MNNKDIVASLSKHSEDDIRNVLAGRNLRSETLGDILDKLDSLTVGAKELRGLSKDEVEKFLVGPRYHDSGKVYPDLLNNEDVDILKTVAMDILNLLTDNDDIELQSILEKLCRKLWPLCSRHSATDNMGFDLQEYADYFGKISIKEKQALRDKILSGWNT